MSNWISVKDRLPGIGDRVICSLENGHVGELFFDDEFLFHKGDYEFEKIPFPVTHWQPLPWAPKP